MSVIEHLGWPIVTLVLGIMFRQPLSTLVTRISSIKAAGIDLSAPHPPASVQQENKVVEPEAIRGEIVSTKTTSLSTVPPPGAELEKRRDAIRSFGGKYPIILENIQVIKKQLEELRFPLGSQETGDILVRHLAVTQMMLRCERTHRLIFGSQIAALHLMNDQGPQPQSMLSPIFEAAKQKAPKYYGSYTFADWIGFLVGQGTVLLQDAGTYSITVYGRSYLLDSAQFDLIHQAAISSKCK
jgi:hypothetical protein